MWQPPAFTSPPSLIHYFPLKALSRLTWLHLQTEATAKRKKLVIFNHVWTAREQRAAKQARQPGFKEKGGGAFVTAHMCIYAISCEGTRTHLTPGTCAGAIYTCMYTFQSCGGVCSQWGHRWVFQEFWCSSNMFSSFPADPHTLVLFLCFVWFLLWVYSFPSI